MVKVENGRVVRRDCFVKGQDVGLKTLAIPITNLMGK